MRHNAVRHASARVFRRLRQKLIVKRAGCLTDRCNKAFTRRIDLYARIIARILASQAAAHQPFKSSVELLDHRHIAKQQPSHRERLDKAEEEMEEMASQIGFLKAPPCVRHLADLNEKLAAALNAKNDTEADRLEKAIDGVNCEAAGDELDEEKQHKTEVVEVTTTEATSKTTSGTTASTTAKPLSCVQKLANLHETYARALSTNDKVAATKAEKEIADLPCGDESEDEDDFTTVSTTRSSTVVPVEQTCAARQASLHAQLATALSAGNSKEAGIVRKQLALAKDECKESMQKACQEEIDEAESHRANLNLELTSLFNEASKCRTDHCRRHLEREIGSAKRELARIRTPTC